jgi:hypothetical protein
MKGRGLALILAAAAAILAMAFAGYEARTALVDRAAERELQAHRDDLAARLRAAQRDLREEAARRQALEQQAQAAASAEPAAAAAPAATLGSSATRSAWLAAHPEARRQYLQAFRAGLSTTWGLLFQAMNLSPDRLEKLKDLLAQREDNDITVEAAAAAQGADESAPAIQALDDRLDAANKAALKDLLGKANYAAVRNYMHAEEIIPLVDQLAGSVYPSSTPLTADQAMGLTQALADSSQKKDSGRVIDGTVNWDEALARAQSILAPGQFATFTAIAQEAQAQAQIEAVKHSLRRAAPPTGAP